MFYNRALTFNFKERRGGFSLAEVVITLLIISIILILAAPHITKRLVPQKTEGIVFTYNGSNTNVNDKCFVYQNSSSGYISTNECSEYRFTVPDGVEKVNLTLVAGGGGGGGAGGGIINEKTQIVEMSSGSSKEFTEYFGNSLQSFIRNIKIKFLAAKGLDGQKISSADDLFQYDSANEVKIKQAKGGNSSPAVVDFIIPQELYRTPYDNAFSAYTKSNNRITASSKLNPDDTKTSVFTLTPRSGNNIVITADSTNGEVYCTANGGNCKIPDKNIIMPVLSKATSAYSLDLSSLPYQSDKSFGTIAGGNGGKLPVYSTYGKGGNGTNINCSNSTSSVGYSLKDFLSSKKINTAQSDMYSWLGQNDIKCSVVSTYTSGSEGAIIYSYEVETPGGVGGGGSGGGAIRIVDFQVASGETYVIRVGKGGAGGGSGQYGYRTYKTNDSSKVIRRKAAQSGGEGGNGVSTSIWKVNGNNETLVYYITGGKGGGGGHVQNITSDTSTSATGGTAGSVIPVIGSGTNENLDVKNFDTTISKPQAGTTCSNAGLSGNKRCSSSTKFYTSGDDIVQPYAYLNNKLSIANNYNDKNGGITLNGLSGNDYTSGGITRTFNSKKYLTAFFQRVAVGSDIGFIGGLGGFSPIGAKAGCGGLFFGNQNGYDAGTNPEYIANNAKTFEVQSFTDASPFTLYKVSDYYDGCSTSTPDGHSAEFIMPNPKTKDLGQAGAGGGGGGYMLFKGAGKGGDGQNGYVMIDWRK